MAASLPAVAFSFGDILDLIEDGINGYLVPYKKEKKFMYYVEESFNDTDLRSKISSLKILKSQSCFQEKMSRFCYQSFRLMI